MEARRRRHSLIFRGHRGNVDNEYCVNIIRHFLGRNLELNPNLYIQQAHRIGNLNRLRRPTIVNFRDFEDPQLILTNAKNPQNTNNWINRDYPKGLISARSTLRPTYKKARVNNPNNSIYI